MQNWVKRGQEGVTWPTFDILAAIFQNFTNRYDVITLLWVVSFGWHLVDRC